MNFDLLIVDDDQYFQFLHKKIAEKSKFHFGPICVSSGEEAIDYIKQKHLDSNNNLLIFLDIYMEGMDGWGVLDYLESLNLPKRFKVILISSSVNHEDKKKAIKSHSVIEYIEKPLLVEYLAMLKDCYIF